MHPQSVRFYGNISFIPRARSRAANPQFAVMRPLVRVDFRKKTGLHSTLFGIKLLKITKGNTMKKIFIPAIIFMLLVITSCSNQNSPAAPGGSSVFVMSFQNGLFPYTSYEGCTDTILVEYNPMLNTFASSDILIAGQLAEGKNRPLIKFDLSAINPNTVRVRSAFLKLAHSYNTGTIAFTSYKMTHIWETTTRWDSWNANDHWATPGGDFLQVTNPVWTALSASGSELVIKLDSKMVEDWINDKTANNGIIITAQNEDTTDYMETHFHSSEAAVPELRPMLTVYYYLSE